MHPVLAAVRELLEREPRIVLAVSGGIDSMTLLDAVSRARTPRHHVIVASFDHGTGAAAREATALAAAEGARRGFGVRTAGASMSRASESEWRAARWRFLRAIARAERAVVATGHNRDDHVETVVMRVLRGAGVRGLAGLLAGEVERPLLRVPRVIIARYAEERGIPYVEDPSNVSRRHLRNRVRHDLLAAITAVRPAFADEMVDVSLRAAEVRGRFETLASECIVTNDGKGTLEIHAERLAKSGEHAAALLWQAIAARAGIVLDWRGTTRLASFSCEARPGTRVQVSGGIEIIRSRSVFILRRAGPSPDEQPSEVRLAGEVRYGSWLFRRLNGATIRSLPVDSWVAAVPSGTELVVRAWHPGDRMRATTSGTERRVKRFFADAKIAGPLREGWPVVVAMGKVVWIPGVRGIPATQYPLDEGVVFYCCERFTE